MVKADTSVKEFINVSEYIIHDLIDLYEQNDKIFIYNKFIEIKPHKVKIKQFNSISKIEIFEQVLHLLKTHHDGFKYMINIEKDNITPLAKICQLRSLELLRILLNYSYDIDFLKTYSIINHGNIFHFILQKSVHKLHDSEMYFFDQTTLLIFQEIACKIKEISRNNLKTLFDQQDRKIINKHGSKEETLYKTPLMHAIIPHKGENKDNYWKYNKKILNIITEYKSCLNKFYKKNNDFIFALHLAVRQNNILVLKLLLKEPKVLIDGPEHFKCIDTPLSLAVKLKHYTCIKILLTKGANTNLHLVNNEHSALPGLIMTPTLWTIYYRDFKSTKLLMEHGGQLHIRENYNNYNNSIEIFKSTELDAKKFLLDVFFQEKEQLEKDDKIYLENIKNHYQNNMTNHSLYYIFCDEISLLSNLKNVQKHDFNQTLQISNECYDLLNNLLQYFNKYLNITTIENLINNPEIYYSIKKILLYNTKQTNQFTKNISFNYDITNKNLQNFCQRYDQIVNFSTLMANYYRECDIKRRFQQILEGDNQDIKINVHSIKILFHNYLYQLECDNHVRKNRNINNLHKLDYICESITKNLLKLNINTISELKQYPQIYNGINDILAKYLEKPKQLNYTDFTTIIQEIINFFIKILNKLGCKMKFKKFYYSRQEVSHQVDQFLNNIDLKKPLLSFSSSNSDENLNYNL